MHASDVRMFKFSAPYLLYAPLHQRFADKDAVAQFGGASTRKSRLAAAGAAAIGVGNAISPGGNHASVATSRLSHSEDRRPQGSSAASSLMPSSHSHPQLQYLEAASPSSQEQMHASHIPTSQPSRSLSQQPQQQQHLHVKSGQEEKSSTELTDSGSFQQTFYKAPSHPTRREQQQRIQEQIEAQQRARRREVMPVPTAVDPNLVKVINGRGAGFDPDKFRQVNDASNSRVLASQSSASPNSKRENESNRMPSPNPYGSPPLTDLSLDDESLMDDILEVTSYHIIVLTLPSRYAQSNPAHRSYFTSLLFILLPFSGPGRFIGLGMLLLKKFIERLTN